MHVIPSVSVLSILLHHATNKRRVLPQRILAAVAHMTDPMKLWLKVRSIGGTKVVLGGCFVYKGLFSDDKFVYRSLRDEGCWHAGTPLMCALEISRAQAYACKCFSNPQKAARVIYISDSQASLTRQIQWFEDALYARLRGHLKSM